MKTLDYERYIFRLMTQEENETIEDYITRLRNQIRKCRFPDVEGQLKDQIIEKCSIKELRQRAFEYEMNLNELINIGKTLERAQRNSRREPIRIFSNRNKSMIQCSRCGFTNHERNDQRCPAKRNVCSNCTKIGHFPRMCFNQRRPERERERERERQRSRSPNYEKFSSKMNNRSRSLSTDTVLSPPAQKQLNHNEPKSFGTMFNQHVAANLGNRAINEPKIFIKTVESLSGATYNKQTADPRHYQSTE